jgi:hypothetical protein
MEARRRPSNVPLPHDRLEQDQQIEVDLGQISLLQHIDEIMPPRSASLDR